MRASAALVLLLGAAAAGCLDDPVKDSQIDALGPEDPDVPPGPRHRPGQPCILCHDGDGPGDGVFSLAGTIYRFRDDAVPLGDAIVRFSDASGRTFSTATNCAGNFFVGPDDFDPDYPLWVSIDYGLFQDIEMSTPIFRDGSCASCHEDPANVASAGHVFLLDVPPADASAFFPRGGCR